jgi:hypothetical protein
MWGEQMPLVLVPLDFDCPNFVCYSLVLIAWCAYIMEGPRHFSRPICAFKETCTNVKRSKLGLTRLYACKLVALKHLKKDI